MPSKAKKLNQLEVRQAKLQKLLRKWDGTPEGRLLLETIMENLKFVDASWHLAEGKDLEALRINKLALEMLRECFTKFKHEAEVIEEELSSEEDETPYTSEPM